MNPKFANQTPMYKAWLPEFQTDEHASKYGAIDVANCARVHAAYCHRDENRDVESNPMYVRRLTWPLLVRVADPAGKEWDVKVAIKFIPEFSPDQPKAVKS